MPYEVDFLPVGEKSKSGDAIALRFGPELTPGKQVVMVVDGGTKSSGEELVKHINDFYGQNHVDHVLLTHPHDDHSSGLTVVLENMTVGTLWMHTPWDSSAEIFQYITDARATKNGLENRLALSLSTAKDLHDLAKAKRIPVKEPFAGEFLTPEAVIIGPSKDYFTELAAQFAKYEGAPAPPSGLGLLGMISEAVLKAIEDAWDWECLGEPGPQDHDPINDSSAILLLNIDGRQIFLSGDAGVIPLGGAAEYATSIGLPINRPHVFKLPHHGSRRNVGPKILDTLMGPKVPKDRKSPDRSGVVSAAPEGKPKHPSQRVVNAAVRRNYTVIQTCGQKLCSYHGAPVRPNWVSAKQLDFLDRYEEGD